MRVVYLDTLFFLNFLTDYLLLLLTARVGGRYPKRSRLAAGAAVGAVFAVLLYFPPAPVAVGWLLRGVTCAGVVLTAFSGEAKSSWPRLCGIFLLLTVGLAGIVLGILLLGGAGVSLQNGVPYINISWTVLLASFIAIYGLSGWVLGKGRGSTARRTHEIQAQLGGKTTGFRVLEDSGNLLRDPISGRKVIVVQASVLEPMFGGELGPLLQKEGDLELQLSQLRQRCGAAFWLIPARTVAQNCMLLAFHPEKLLVDGAASEEYLLGVTAQQLEIGGDCRGLIGV